MIKLKVILLNKFILIFFTIVLKPFPKVGVILSCYEKSNKPNANPSQREGLFKRSELIGTW